MLSDSLLHEQGLVLKSTNYCVLLESKDHQYLTMIQMWLHHRISPDNLMHQKVTHDTWC